MVGEDLERLLKMRRVQDQKPIQTFGPNGPYEPFRDSVCLRSLNRRPNHTHGLGLKHGIEATGELTIAVANQKPERLVPLNEFSRDPSRLFCVTHASSDVPCSRPCGHGG